MAIGFNINFIIQHFVILHHNKSLGGSVCKKSWLKFSYNTKLVSKNYWRWCRGHPTIGSPARGHQSGKFG